MERVGTEEGRREEGVIKLGMVDFMVEARNKNCGMDDVCVCGGKCTLKARRLFGDVRSQFSVFT